MPAVAPAPKTAPPAAVVAPAAAATKLTLATKALVEALARVERIIPKSSSHAGATLIAIDLAPGSVELGGTNLDLDVRARLDADVTGSGRYAMPAQVLAQVARALPGDDVTFEFGPEEVAVASGSFDTKIRLVAAENAPTLRFPTAFDGEIDGAALARALEHARYAAAVADYQAVFRAVRLELHPQRTRAIATDGFRLASHQSDADSGLDADLLIPARSVDELLKLLADGPAKLAISGAQLTVATGPYTLNLKLMEGAFPDYERVIPKAFPVEVAVDASALAQAVGRVAVMADKAGNHRVDLVVMDGRLQITSEGAFGRAEEELEVEQQGSDSRIALAYNARFLSEALAPIAGRVRLRFSGVTSPTVVDAPADPAYLAMVVPLRTG
jgi:DNA polymerase-3 subunit beta